MVDFQLIEEAQKRISSYIQQTPLKQSNFLSDLCKGEVYLKLENQQLTNSFKIRGALNKILTLSSEEMERGIITASSGNHAQAVGIVAEQLNISAKIIVPVNTPTIKLQKIKKNNVILELNGANYDEAEIVARSLEKEEGRTFISAYNDKLIIAGQGTIGLEIYDKIPSVSDVLIPLGGGGLISGIAIALKKLNPSIRIYGVQTEACPAFYESIKEGKIVDVAMSESIADGMYGGIEKDSITFGLVEKFVEDIFVVKESTIKQALALLWKKEKERVEGAAAAAIAPILENKSLFQEKIVASIISGGNIDEKLFQEIIAE